MASRARKNLECNIRSKINTPSNDMKILKDGSLAFLKAAYRCHINPCSDNINEFTQFSLALDKVGNAVIKALSLGKYEMIRVVFLVIEKLVRDAHMEDHIKVGTLRILEYLCKLGVYPVCCAVEKLIPVFIKTLKRANSSDDIKAISLANIGSLFSNSETLRTLKKIKKMTEFLKCLITNDHHSDRVKEEALKTLIYSVFLERSELEVQTLLELLPIARRIISEIQTTKNLKKVALGVVMRLMTGGRCLIQAPEANGIVAEIESLIYSKNLDQPRETAFWTAVLFTQSNQNARNLVNEIIQHCEDIIMRRGTLGFPPQDETLKIFGICTGNSTHGALMVLKKIAHLNFHLVKETLERLFPALRALMFDPEGQDFLKYEIFEILGLAAFYDERVAHKLIKTQTLSLSQIILDARLDHEIKQKAIIAVKSGLSPLIRGPKVELGRGPYASISLEKVLREAGCASAPRFLGRNLVYYLENHRLLVIKLLKIDQTPSALLNEAYWIKYINHLREQGRFRNVRFDVPELIKCSKADVVRISNIPDLGACTDDLHPDRYALCYTVHSDYFSYPNMINSNKMFTPDEVAEILSRGAFLLGYLISCGVIHTSPIPLFHARLQLSRPDRAYLWWYKGSIEQWVGSCDYPNVGKTGLRDFEHFISWGMDELPYGYNDQTGIFHFIGSHLLSLLLITGSYFRNLDRAQLGFDHQGNFVDARDLFNVEVLKKIVRVIFHAYYQGFLGEAYDGELPLDFDVLTQRMIEEMGVDRWMHKVIRRRTQMDLHEEVFTELIRKSGYPKQTIKNINKGESDILIIDGPHLASDTSHMIFPELINSLETTGALCIVRKALKSGKTH